MILIQFSLSFLSLNFINSISIRSISNSTNKTTEKTNEITSTFETKTESLTTIISASSTSIESTTKNTTLKSILMVNQNMNGDINTNLSKVFIIIVKFFSTSFWTISLNYCTLFCFCFFKLFSFFAILNIVYVKLS